MIVGVASYSVREGGELVVLFLLAIFSLIACTSSSLGSILNSCFSCLALNSLSWDVQMMRVGRGGGGGGNLLVNGLYSGTF